MFTGLIEEIGKVVRAKKVGGGVHLTVVAPNSSRKLSIHDSVAINGCCQTVIAREGDTFTVEAVEETLKKTTLGFLQEDSPVNLELAMKLGERLGGHLVLGHVDGVGIVKLIEKKESSALFTITIPRDFRRYVVPVGSIAIDGVSLTIARLHADEVTVSIIPHTRDHTTFQFFKTGDRVNVEFDVVGKHIEQIMMHPPENLKYALSAEKLKEWGYGS